MGEKPLKFYVLNFQIRNKLTLGSIILWREYITNRKKINNCNFFSGKF
jgi:hypothetical protein